MSLVLTQGLIDYDKIFPKIGCGLKFFFEEDDFIVSVGVKSTITLDIDSGVATLTDGDYIDLHGYKFTFVTGSTENVNQVLISGITTNQALEAQLDKIPFFLDNYNITLLGTTITIENKKAIVDSSFSFSKTLVNANAIVSSALDAGSNPVLKGDYYIFFEVFDRNTGAKLCAQPIAMPLNVFANLDNKVGINIQPIIERFPELKTKLPAPFAPNPAYPQKVEDFDSTYLGKFYFRVWNSYKDPESVALCEKVQSDLIVIPQDLPTSATSIVIANFIREEDDCEGIVESAFEPYSFYHSAGLQKFLTVMPETYKICRSTAVEVRFDMPVFTLVNAFSADVQFHGRSYYSDGSSSGVIFNWGPEFDGVHIANLSFIPNDPSSTIITDPNKTLIKFEYTIKYIIGAITFTPLETRTIYFQNDLSATVKCCDGVTSLYFLSTVGNNDMIISRPTEQDLEVEFYEFCKEQKCCGTETNGVKQYQSGNVSSGLKSSQRIYTVLLETKETDYLDQFLLSPFKYEYDKETDSIYQIVPTQNSYKIFLKNLKNIIKFTYRRTLIRQHFKL